MIDRIAPTRRPALRAAGTQRWRDLLFVHWAFPLDVVRPLVPAALSLDEWEGTVHVGLVPFAMEGVRSAWMPKAVGLNFLETNVRTYVHYRGRPGVYFFSLEASSWLAVQVARLGWGLPYFHASMSYDRVAMECRCQRAGSSAGMHASWKSGDELGPSKEGSLEFFLLERYLLFSERGGRLYEGQVHHAPYPAKRVELASLEDTLLDAAGLPPRHAPVAAHFSHGVDVEVFGPWPVTD